MKLYVISDNIDTLVGMRLAGIEGVVVHEEQEIKEALDKAVTDESIGVVLMTEKLISRCREYVYGLKLNLKQPLIVEIPDRHGNSQISDNISEYVREAVGIKI